MHGRPPLLCSICDYEFEHGERPALAYFMRPAFLEADDRRLVTGAFCIECARMPKQRLIEAFALHLRESWPHFEVLRPQ